MFVHYLFGFFTRIWPSCTYNIHQIVQGTVRGGNETAVTERRSLEKNKAGGFSFEIKEIRELREITAAKNGDFYRESPLSLSRWICGEES